MSFGVYFYLVFTMTMAMLQSI